VLDRQDDCGSWPSGGYAQVGIDAEDLLYREFAGIRTADLTAATARWIRSRQQTDGSWSGNSGRRGDLTVSVLAYLALRLAGDSPDAYHMAMAAGWIRDTGGMAAAGIRARIWLALCGHAEWGKLPVPPPEAVYLPPSCPVRLPGEPGWGRPTLIPLAVIGALRPVLTVPFGLAELTVAPDINRPATATRMARRASGLAAVDAGLRVYRHSLPVLPLGAARAAALRACGDWITAARAPGGSWPGSVSGWLFSLMALELLGHQQDEPVLARGLTALDEAATWTPAPTGPMRRLEIRSAPVTASALATSALADSGLAADHQALQAAAAWLIEAEISARTRWLSGRQELPPAEAAVVRGLPAGIEETAAVVLALRRARLPAAAGQLPATTIAVRWLAAMQRKDGGWGRFAAGPGSALKTRLPLFDVGDVRDASAADMTAWAVRALAAASQPGSRAVRRGVAWLLRIQLPDGSWPGADGTGDLLVTAAVLEALATAGVVPTKSPVLRAADWLVQRQQSDGGFEESRPGGSPGAAAPAPLPTARALTALLRVGGQDLQDAIDRAAAFLVSSQQPGGTWTGPLPDAAGPAAAAAAGRSLPARDTGADQAMVINVAALAALGQYLGAR
jgi:squalene-hopene/tetraprenyl-beta-curcumene cyclase